MNSRNCRFDHRVVCRIRRLSLAGLMIVTLSAGISCQPSSPQSGSVSPVTERSAVIPISTGSVMSDHISFQLCVVYLPKPKSDPLPELDALLNDKFIAVQRVEVIVDVPTKRLMSAQLETDPKKNFLLPDPEYLKKFGKGLTDKQAEDVQNSEAVLILEFGHPKEDVLDGLRDAQTIVQTLARSSEGLIWDDATRELYAPDEWERRRFEGWDGRIPNVARQTTIHAYQTDKSVRAITLGMSKFGVPDLVVEEFSWSNQRNIGHVLNLLGQAFVEGTEISQPGQFDLDMHRLKNSEAREAQITKLKSNATGVLQLSLQRGAPEEGDPDNRLIEITFDRGNGPDVHARQTDVLSRGFGADDEVQSIQHDDAIKAASEQARKKLPSLRGQFKKGLAPGEYLLVKAPFKRPSGGNEWMWVEVSRWQGKKITGLLQNDPFDIPDLKAGQAVEVSESDVFDYIRVFADGHQEGNETAKLIQKQSE